jgi:hypothetical protein
LAYTGNPADHNYQISQYTSDAPKNSSLMQSESSSLTICDTPEADEMEVLVTLIEVYENKH